MRTSTRTWLLLAGIVLMAATLGACGKRKRYPDLRTGWHNDDYTELFGRLNYVPAKTEDDKPSWVLRYSDINDRYNGRVVLIPPEKMTGYGGAEQVAVKGRLRLDMPNPAGTGTFFEVYSIRIWNNYAQH